MHCNCPSSKTIIEVIESLEPETHLLFSMDSPHPQRTGIGAWVAGGHLDRSRAGSSDPSTPWRRYWHILR